MKFKNRIQILLLSVSIASVMSACTKQVSGGGAEPTLEVEKPSYSETEELEEKKTLVSVWAGMLSPGFEDGSNTEASFIKPYGLCKTPEGNMLIVDCYANLLRVSAEGTISTIAGSTDTMDEAGYPFSGYLNGESQKAVLNRPRFAAVSNEGIVIFSDTGNHRIRAIYDGSVRLYAGEGTAGYQDGDYKTARFNTPSGVAIGRDGTVYVADTLNHCIRAIASDGQVSTVAGIPGDPGFLDGSVEEARFCEPNDIELGADGALYVVDKGNQRIRKVAGEQVSTVAGSGDEIDSSTGYIIGGYEDGSAKQARFKYPTGLNITADGMIYVADTGNHSIRSISPDGNVLTVAGSRMSGNADGDIKTARFNQPLDVLYREDMLYISDSYNHSIRAVDLGKE